MRSKSGFKFPIIQLIFVIILIIADQYTKSLAVKNLKDAEPKVLIDGVLELRYLENRGAAFGMLQGKLAFFVFISVFILFAVFYLMAIMPKQRRYAPLNLVFIFVAAGAVGNMADRIRLNYVVDFIYFSLIDFPIFNVADIYVTCSMAVLILLLLFYYREDELYFLGFNSHKYRDR